MMGSWLKAIQSGVGIGVALAGSVSLPATAIAQSDCFRANSGYFGPSQEAWLLVMQRPEIEQEFVLSGTATAEKNLVIASQTYVSSPTFRYLTEETDIVYRERSGEMLSKFMPFGLGAPISIWSNGQTERHCTIGWRNGLFGGATGDGHYRWSCLEDTDDNGFYDTAWRPRGNSARISMPMPTPSGWSEEPLPETANYDNSLPDRFEESREVLVSKLNRREIRFEYRGVGVLRGDANRVELSTQEAQTVEFQGLTITLTPSGSRNPPTIEVTGQLPPQTIRPICGGSTYSIDGSRSSTRFSFPSW